MIDHIIKHIMLAIPRDILVVGFTEIDAKRNPRVRIDQIITLEDKIRSQIIDNILIDDLNIYTGTETVVRLDKCSIMLINPDELITTRREFIVDVPFEFTNYKKITRAVSLVTGLQLNSSGSLSSYQYSEPSPLIAAANNLFNANTRAPIAVSATLRVIGNNMIHAVGDIMSYISNGALSVVIENENNLQNFDQRMMLTIANIAILATKAYIYNKLIVYIDQGALYKGHELGVIKDKISEYSDAYTMYQEAIKKTPKLHIFNNREVYKNYIRSYLGSNI